MHSATLAPKCTYSITWFIHYYYNSKCLCHSTSNQEAINIKTRKSGLVFFKYRFVCNNAVNCYQTLAESETYIYEYVNIYLCWNSDGILPKLCPAFPPATAALRFSVEPYGKVCRNSSKIIFNHPCRLGFLYIISNFMFIFNVFIGTIYICSCWNSKSYADRSFSFIKFRQSWRTEEFRVF